MHLFAYGNGLIFGLFDLQINKIKPYGIIFKT